MTQLNGYRSAEIGHVSHVMRATKCRTFFFSVKTRRVRLNHRQQFGCGARSETGSVLATNGKPQVRGAHLQASGYFLFHPFFSFFFFFHSVKENEISRLFFHRQLRPLSNFSADFSSAGSFASPFGTLSFSTSQFFCRKKSANFFFFFSNSNSKNWRRI